jgi:methyl coenzyme M reductase beta subunit
MDLSDERGEPLAEGIPLQAISPLRNRAIRMRSVGCRWCARATLFSLTHTSQPIATISLTQPHTHISSYYLVYL